MAQGWQSSVNQRVELPEDSQLPGLTVMLDQDLIASVFSEHLNGPYAEFGRSEIRYVRYKRSTSCIIAYALDYPFDLPVGGRQLLLYGKLYTDADYENAAAKARAHRWIELPGTRPVVDLPEQRCLMYLFPNDCVIEGLRLLSDPKKIQRLLYQYLEQYPETRWRISDRKLRLVVTRYKPERRAVLRCETRAVNRRSGERQPLSVYLRIYGDKRGAEVFAVQQSLWDYTKTSKTLTVPKPLGYLPDRELLLMETIQGRPLLEALTDQGDTDCVTCTAQALAELHRHVTAAATSKQIAEYLQEAIATAQMLESILPHAKDELNGIGAALLTSARALKACPQAFAHGDFYYGQVLLDGDRVGIIDFDRAHAGEALADVGNFCAHLRNLILEGRLSETYGRHLENVFVEAYTEATGRQISPTVLTFWTGLCLLMLAVGPFRRVEPLWPSKTESIIQQCLSTLT